MATTIFIAIIQYLYFQNQRILRTAFDRYGEVQKQNENQKKKPK